MYNLKSCPGSFSIFDLQVLLTGSLMQIKPISLPTTGEKKNQNVCTANINYKNPVLLITVISTN